MHRILSWRGLIYCLRTFSRSPLLGPKVSNIFAYTNADCSWLQRARGSVFYVVGVVSPDTASNGHSHQWPFTSATCGCHLPIICHRKHVSRGECAPHQLLRFGGLCILSLNDSAPRIYAIHTIAAPSELMSAAHWQVTVKNYVTGR